MIFALILAAGESRRMGRQKLLLPFGDTTVVGAVARAALASRADQVLAVVGADHEAVEGALAPLGVEVIVNREFESGMLSSVQAGFASLPEGAEAAVVMLGDQPFVTPAVIDRLIEARRRSGRSLIVPTHGGRRGHPLLVGLELRERVMALDPSEGLRGLVRSSPGLVTEVEVGEPGILRDIDTKEDYER